MGFFITLEGADGVGKTTQAKLLKEALDEKYDVLLTREPGGTELSEKIRTLIEENEKSSATDLLLFCAARRDHVEKIIEPHLAKPNAIVICDRFIDSTTVYQGYLGNINLETVKFFNDFSSKNLIPDLTFFLFGGDKTNLEMFTEHFCRLQGAYISWLSHLGERNAEVSPMTSTITIEETHKNLLAKVKRFMKER